MQFARVVFVFFLLAIYLTLSSCAETELIETEIETAFSSLRGLIDRYIDKSKALKMARAFGLSSFKSIFSGGFSTVVLAASLAIGAITAYSFFESPISPLPVPPLPKPPVGRFPPEHPVWPPQHLRAISESAPRPVYANPLPGWNYNRRLQLPSGPVYPPPQPVAFPYAPYQPIYHYNHSSLNDLNSFPTKRKVIDDAVDEMSKSKAKMYTMRNGPVITYNSTNKVHFNTPRSFKMLVTADTDANNNNNNKNDNTKPAVNDQSE